MKGGQHRGAELARRFADSEAADDALTVEGVVRKVTRGDLHVIEVTVGEATRTIHAKRSGHLAGHRIHCIAGDRVRVALNEYDPARGRIVARL